MFAALNVLTNERYITLDAKWLARAEVLREMARDEELVCPECRDLLWYKYNEEGMGESRRQPHFSHRADTGCKAGKKSFAVSDAQAMLFCWLDSKFPGKVEVDRPMEVRWWDRPADVYLARDGEKPIAYWIFDRCPQGVDALTRFVHHWDEAFEVQWILAAGMRKEWKGDVGKSSAHPRALKMSRNAKNLIRVSEFDHLSQEVQNEEVDGHLTFLDPDSGELLIYRSVYATACGGDFAWKVVRRGALSTAIVADETGELIFAQDICEAKAAKESRAIAIQAAKERKAREEADQKRRQQEREAARLREEIARREARVIANAKAEAERVEREKARTIRAQEQAEACEQLERSWERARVETAAKPKPVPPNPPSTGAAPVGASLQPLQHPQWAFLARELKCKKCGESTTDWIAGTPSLGTCTCRRCSKGVE